MTRAYPKGLRIGSSNYDPFPALLSGCQLVALNYQTEDKTFRLYELFFQENGKCGYILKPQVLRDPAMKECPDIFNEGPVAANYVLHVKVLSAEHLPKANKSDLEQGTIISPFVTLQLIGSRDRQKKTTAVVCMLTC